MPASHVTLAELKNYLSITSTTHDAKLSNLIIYVSKLVDTYCSREFAVGNVTEYVSGGRSSVFLSKLPVNNVYFVAEYDGLEYIPLIGPDASGALPNVVANANATPEYSFNSSTGELFKGYSVSPQITITGATPFNNYVNGIKVTYNGGYTDIPYDLKMAVMDLVKGVFKGDEGRSQRLEGESQTNFPPSGGMAPHVRRVLDLYRLLD